MCQAYPKRARAARMAGVPSPSSLAETRSPRSAPRDDTVYAPATAPGTAALAVVRVSGPQAHAVARRLACRKRPFVPRQATRAILRCPQSQAVIDDALVLWFEAPRSATGEDVVEFHLHGAGGRVEALLEALASFPALRPALAGEFAWRGFCNGKLDLAQLEALSDLMVAESRREGALAASQLSGTAARTLAPLRARLTAARAGLEAGLEFSEDSDAAARGAQARTLDFELAAIAETLERLREAAAAAARVRARVEIVLLGVANAGKSSLFNALLERDAALVSDTAGTTRDALPASATLDGRAVRFIDTAGLGAGADALERAGQERALGAAAGAGAVLAVIDSARDAAPQLEVLAPAIANARAGGAEVLFVASKCDLAPPPVLTEEVMPCLAVSALSGLGLEALRARLVGWLARADAPLRAAEAVASRGRGRDLLEQAYASVCAARVAAGADAPELAAEELEDAARALAQVSGGADFEEVLDALFASFCLGK